MIDYLHTASGPESIRLGWALVHFLWQGLVIAVVLEIVLNLSGRKNASLRYGLCGLALAAIPLCLVGTYWALDPGVYGSTIEPIATQAQVAGQAAPQVTQVMTELTARNISSLDLNRCMPGIVVGWLMGVLVLTGRKAGGFIVLWRLRRRGISSPSKAVAESFRRACAKIGLDPGKVCLKISTMAQVPMTMGWARPIILFPAALLSGLSTREIELLLSHELAHIRRWDYLVNLLQTAVETLFFYHPVTWWISRRMRQERENACDDLVTSCSMEKLAYAKALLQLESIRLPGDSLASAANGGRLLPRVQRLIGEPVPTSGMGLPLLLVLLSLLGATATISGVKAEEASTNQLANVPMAPPAPSNPEASFAEPVTMKEIKGPGDFVTRLYYQGGNLILQQELNASPGSIGQIVFYQGAEIVDDVRGTTPIAFSSRTVWPNNFKMNIQSIAADSVSPAQLRVLDASQQIVSEFFIDQNGLMRPITKAEHAANIALRREKLKPPVLTATVSNKDDFITRPDTEAARAMMSKLRATVMDVNFNKVDVAVALQFFAQKSAELAPDKKGIHFVLRDITPQDHVHREVSVVLDQVPLDDLLDYVVGQTNLKCSLVDDTVYLGP